MRDKASERHLRSIYSFPVKADPNKNPLHIVYPCVTFSEVKTFDLMKLLASYRRSMSFNANWLGDIIHKHTAEEIRLLGSDDYINTLLHFKKHGSFPESKWLIALKKELSKRRHLTKFEKKCLNKRRYN